MKNAISRLILGALFIVALSPATSADEIVKPPDLGAFWAPLSPNGGTYIYADSFVAINDGAVSSLGTWLLSLDGDGAGSTIAFEVYGSIGGNAAFGPDSTNVLASTGLLDIGGGTSSLEKYSAAPLFSSALVGGETYWFGANVIGGSGGSYQTGGHTQNSVYNDDGTFWFSNDPTGVSFDGQGFTPEIAFQVGIKGGIVPEPSTAVVCSGLAMLAICRRRR